jgi:hypothetical protein
MASSASTQSSVLRPNALEHQQIRSELEKTSECLKEERAFLFPLGNI